MLSPTGHLLGDAILPSALRLVGAVKTGDAREITEAIAAAYEASGRHPYWFTALLIVTAGMVPDDATPNELLAWNQIEPDA